MDKIELRLVSALLWRQMAQTKKKLNGDVMFKMLYTCFQIGKTDNGK
jgi:hypothetical protein